MCVLSSAVPVCAVDRQARMSGPELLEAVGNAERERAAAPDEVPLGEWEAVRVRPDCNAPLISQALLANAEEAKSLLQVPHCTFLLWLCQQAESYFVECLAMTYTACLWADIPSPCMLHYVSGLDTTALAP